MVSPLQAIVPYIKENRKAREELIGYTGGRDAILGNGATPNVVIVPPSQAEIKGAMWARLVDGQGNITELIQVAQHYPGINYDSSVTDVAVRVGYPPGSKALSIIGMADTLVSSASYNGLVPSQYRTYKNNATTMNRILDLRIKAAGGLEVKLATGHYIRDGVLYFYKHDGKLDLTSYVPSSSNLMKWVLVYLSSSDALGVVDGTEYDIGQLVPVNEGCPTALPSGAVCGAAVRLYNGQTEIVEEQDIYSLPHLISVSTASSNTVDAGIMRGVLTLESGVAYSTSDQTAKTTLYYTPIDDGTITLWNTTDSVWEEHTLTEKSISVPATTNTIYDVFVYDNSGTLTLELVAWTNDTTRATALDTQNGWYVQTGAKNKRHIGMMRTTGVSGQTETATGTQDANWYVTNRYNKKWRYGRIFDNSTFWNSSNTSWESYNTSSSNRYRLIYIDDGDPIDIRGDSAAFNSGGSSMIGYGVDSTTVNSADVWNDSGGAREAIMCAGQEKPSEGMHYIQALQRVNAGTAAFYGIASAGPEIQSGFSIRFKA